MSQAPGHGDPDLRIESVSADRTTVQVGDVVRLTVAYNNAYWEPSVNTDAEIAVQISGSGRVGVTPCFSSSTTCSWVLFGSSAGTVYFYVRALAPGEVTLHMSAAAARPDPNPANNAADVTLSVTPAGAPPPATPVAPAPIPDPVTMPPARSTIPVARCDVYAVSPGKVLTVPPARGLLRNDTFAAGASATPQVTEIAFRKSSHPYSVAPDGSLKLATLKSDTYLTFRYAVSSAGKLSNATTVKIFVQKDPVTIKQRGQCPQDRPPVAEEPQQADAKAKAKVDTLAGSAKLTFRSGGKQQTVTLNVAYDAAINPGSIAVTGYASATSTVALQRICLRQTWFVDAGRNSSSVRPISSTWEDQQPGLDYDGVTLGKTQDVYRFRGIDRENSNARAVRSAFTSSQPLAWATGKPLLDIKVTVEMGVSTAARGCSSPLYRKAITVD